MVGSKQQGFGRGGLLQFAQAVGGGFAHGGLQATLADITLTFMGAAALGPSVLTSEFKINFLRPAQGDTLIGRGAVLSAGKRQAVTRCDIYAAQDGQEKLVATALGTIARADVP